MNSLIGMDSICPLPPVATMNFVRSGLRGVKPAAESKRRASAGSCLILKLGLPNQGDDGSTTPTAGFANPFINATTPFRSIAKFAA